MVKFLQKLAQSSYEQVATGSYPAAAAAIGTARYLGHNVKHTVNDTANKIERRPCTSATRNEKGHYLGVLGYRNNITYESINFALLGNAFGTCTTTGSDPYTHVFDELESPDLPPFNYEHVWDSSTDEVRVYNGCTVDNLTLSCAKGEPVMTSVDYIAAYCYKAGSKESLAEDTTNPYMWHETRLWFDIASTGAYTSASEQLGILNWSWKISNNLVAEPRCESTPAGGNITRPQATARAYELTFTWDMDDDDMYDLLDAATDCAYQVYIYRGANDYLKITIEEAQVSTAPDNMDAEGDLVPQTVTFIGGEIDVGTATNVQCIDSYGTSGGGEEYPAD